MVIPNIPFVAAGDATLMTPDERLSIDELVDVEFQRLRSGQIVSVEIYVIDEMAQAWHDRATVVR